MIFRFISEGLGRLNGVHDMDVPEFLKKIFMIGICIGRTTLTIGTDILRLCREFSTYSEKTVYCRSPPEA